ncbi:tyrosine-type recombinase/integrase [Streptomyces coelicoflavus]|uniref:tyrosine-type recombinase/integrase n=1 Tax=Streptomyces coelicoflavus TaxID=285562 RepID=UPI00332F8A17
MRRARAAALPIVRPDLVEFYLAHRAAQGMNTDHKVRWGARALLAAVPDLEDFRRLPLDRRLAFNHETHRFISWLSVTGRLQPGADYLVARRPRLGIVLARTEPELHLRFMETARTLGFRDTVAMTQFNLLAHFVALFGRQPHELQQSDWDEGRRLLLEAARCIPNRGVKALSTALFNRETTLFHCELTDQLPRRRSPDRADIRAREWACVPAGMTDTMQHYLQQIAGTLRPGTVKNAELTLREFALLVATEDAAVACVAELKRRHVERYRQWLLERPAARGGPLHRHTVRDRLSKLRGFLRRLDEWDAADRPPRQLIFDSDFPIADEPLPRFLDDAAAAKLLAAARQDPDPFARLAIEILARTGMRRSEMLGLTVDAVVQIGSAYWLRVPVGKMHTDRYVPLHPQLKTLLDDWLLHRPESLRSNLLFTDRGRPVNASRIEAAVRKAAQQAGLGRVTPHQLRHTLATQAINRGMSLEAIAALLGHRSLSMTRVYARIADRTVADEYFAVSEKVEALYDAPRQLPADAEGTEMAKLRREMHRRMLGNGYCDRPVEMDCHFERSVNRAHSSSPRSSSGPPSNASETTRQRRDKSHASRSSTDSSADSMRKHPDCPASLDVTLISTKLPMGLQCVRTAIPSGVELFTLHHCTVSGASTVNVTNSTSASEGKPG